jgi:hypothetical protein
LSKLTADQRVEYYRRVCDSLGLNYWTQPFGYIVLNQKLTLYAKKDAADQLRRKHNISIGKPDIRFEDDWIIVTVTAHDGEGREDSDVGVVSRRDMRGDFGNALMKAVTKAKRRVTLSIVGLGWLDETEVETIPDARVVDVAAIEAPKAETPQATKLWIENPATRKRWWAWVAEQGLSNKDAYTALGVESLHAETRTYEQCQDAVSEWVAAQAMETEPIGA